MPAVHPYLTFNGTCEAAFAHYKSVFGGEYTYLGRFKDMPAGEGAAPMDATTGELIMHVSLPIGNATTLFGSDTSVAFGQTITMGDNISISINADSKAEADRLFNGLSEGGKVTMPLADTFWGAYFGMFTDKFGINWMVNHDVSPEA